MRRAFPIAVAALLIACRGHDRAPDPAVAADSGVAGFDLLKTDVTLGAWLQAHAGDSLKVFDRPNLQPHAYSLGPFEFGDWCARAKGYENGSRIVRLAYFYPPALVSGADLPTSGDHQRVRGEGCTLGLLLLVTPEADSTRGIALAAELQQLLQQRFGAGPTAAGGLSRYWTGTLAWQAGGLAFAVAFSQDSGADYESEEEGGPAELTRYGDDQRGVVAVAYRPRPGIGDREFAHLDRDDERPEQYPVAMVRLGAEATGIADTQRLLRLASKLERFAEDRRRHAEQRIPNDSLFAALEAWIAATRTLPAPRRAAALFAADALLDYGHNQLDAFALGGGADSAGRVRLMALGAGFMWSHYDIVDYVYTGSWRRAADSLGATGAVADSLFSTETEHPGVCVVTDSVIAATTRYLAAPHAAVMQARAHLALARAYGDKLLWPNAGDAAAQAARHYREALRLGRGTPLETVAWSEGWRVSAGLLPVRARFYCSSGD